MNRIFWILIQNLQLPVSSIQVGFWPIRAIHEWVEGTLNDYDYGM